MQPLLICAKITKIRGELFPKTKVLVTDLDAIPRVTVATCALVMTVLPLCMCPGLSLYLLHLAEYHPEEVFGKVIEIQGGVL